MMKESHMRQATGENRSQSPRPEPETGKHDKQARFLRLGAILLPMGLVLAVCLFLGAQWLHYYLTHITINDARVKGEIVTVSPSVQGRIRLLSVQEGDRVEAGQVIAQLQDEDYRTQVEMAAAAVRAVEAEIKEAEALLTVERQKTSRDVSRETAALDAARARLDALQTKRGAAAQQQPKGSSQGYVYYESKPSFDHAPLRGRPSNGEDAALRQIEEAKAEVKEREASLQAAKTVKPTPEAVAAEEQHMEALKARLAEAQARLVSANRSLSATTITSPLGGIVAVKAANTGEMVKPGQSIIAVVSLDHLWIEANLEDAQFGRVRPGQIADLKVDAYPQRAFTGTVVNIGAAASAELSPAAENHPAGSPKKITQRIPVRIQVSDPDHLLRPGMTASVRIDLRTGKNETGSGFGKIESSVKPLTGAGQ